MSQDEVECPEGGPMGCPLPTVEDKLEKLRTENQRLKEALEKIRSNMFLVCQPNHGHFFGEVDDLITEALASEGE